MTVESPRWFKSSYSDNGGNCVEVAWFKSSYSSNGGNCVEVAWAKSSHSENGGVCVEWAPEHARATGEVLVRDSKDPEGPHLTLTAAQWTSFVAFAAAMPAAGS